MLHFHGAGALMERKYNQFVKASGFPKKNKQSRIGR